MAAANPISQACSRILWNNNAQAIVTGRTMDWVDSTQPQLWMFPRGIKRVAKLRDNPKKWTSKYGSLVTSAYNAAAADGVNEKRLAGHFLYLRSANYGSIDSSKPSLSSLDWLQYVLDNYANVDEAVADSKNWQIVVGKAGGHEATVHLAIEDESGDSAIFEFIKGKLIVHHGPQYTVMTNDPPYDQQLKEIKKYVGFGGKKPLPGNILSPERFVRAAYFLKHLPKPKDLREAVAGVMSVARNVSVPWGAPYDQFSSYPTIYRTITDLNDGTYYWEYTQSPNLFWVDSAKINYSSGAPIMRLDPSNITLAGEVNSKFQKAAKSPF